MLVLAMWCELLWGCEDPWKNGQTQSWAAGKAAQGGRSVLRKEWVEG